MRQYETTFIIDPDLSEDGRGQIFEKIRTLIEKEKGFIVDFDEWGQKKLAYEIRKKNRGFYVCINFCGSTQLVDELERTSRLDDKIMKYMTILLEDNVDVEKVKEKMAALKKSKEEALEKKASENVKGAPDDDSADLDDTIEDETESDKEEA